MKAYAVTVLILTDEEDAVRRGERKAEQGPVTLSEIESYLENTVSIKWDKEKHGNPCGIKMIHAAFDGVRELKPSPVIRDALDTHVLI